MTKKRGNKRHHHFAENKNQQNHRQKDQTEAGKNPYHPEEDNDLLDYYGADDVSDESRGKQYAVFDFDNTCSIFDVEEQLAIYQLCTMAFEIEPEDMRSVLLTDLETPEKDLSEFGYGKGSLEDWAGDISDAYSILWEKYGPFTSEGVDESTMDELEEDSD